MTLAAQKHSRKHKGSTFKYCAECCSRQYDPYIDNICGYTEVHYSLGKKNRWDLLKYQTSNHHVKPPAYENLKGSEYWRYQYSLGPQSKLCRKRPKFIQSSEVDHCFVSQESLEDTLEVSLDDYLRDYLRYRAKGEQETSNKRQKRTGMKNNRKRRAGEEEDQSDEEVDAGLQWACIFVEDQHKGDGGASYEAYGELMTRLERRGIPFILINVPPQSRTQGRKCACNSNSCGPCHKLPRVRRDLRVDMNDL
jgi:hypothetical protein